MGRLRWARGMGIAMIVVLGALGVGTHAAQGEDGRRPPPAQAPSKARATKRPPRGPAASTARPCFEVQVGTQPVPRCLPSLPSACRAAGCALGEPAVHPCGVYQEGGRLVPAATPEAQGLRGGRVACFGW